MSLLLSPKSSSSSSPSSSPSSTNQSFATSLLQSMTVPRHKSLINSLYSLRVAIKKLQDVGATLEEYDDEEGDENDEEEENKKTNKKMNKKALGTVISSSSNLSSLNKEVTSALNNLQYICNSSCIPTTNTSGSESDTSSSSSPTLTIPSYSTSTSYWSSVLTYRQRTLLTQKPSNLQTFNTPFWSQVKSTASKSSPSPPPTFDDSRLYKDMLYTYLRNTSTPSVSTYKSSTTTTSSKKRKSTTAPSNSVDRKGSKGRRIRYGVKHGKIENFGIVRDRGEGDEDVWFKAVWGGRRYA